MANNGLDLLLAPQAASAPQMGASAPQNGLDVLMTAPIQPQQPTAPQQAPSGIGQGAKDVWNAAAQNAYMMMPQGVQSAGNSLDNWLYDKTGGAVGTKPGTNINDLIRTENQNYEAQRAAAGKEGIDWGRVGGSAGAQALLSALLKMPASAGGAGAMSGALSPVTNIPEGSNDGTDFALEKAKQVGTGFVGGKIIGGIGNILSKTLSPKISQAAQYLADQGISLTPGQTMGGYLKSLEDKLTSFPVLGNAINQARGRGIEDLNKAAYQRVIDPLKEAGIEASMPERVGREGVASISDTVSKAYNNLQPKLSLVVDNQLSGELNTLKTMAAKGLPSEQANEFARIYDNVIDSNIVNGQSSGKFLQGMLSDIRTKAAGYQSDSSFTQRQLGDALASVDSSLRSALQRSNPEFAQKLSAINESFANLARIQTAAQSIGAKEGVFNADQLAAAVRGGDNTVRNNAYAQGNALMQDLSDPAKKILPSSIPNSGTADRFNIGNPASWVGAVGAGLYQPGAQRFAQKALMGARPEAVKALVNALEKYSPQLTTPLTAESLNAVSSYLKNRPAAQ